MTIFHEDLIYGRDMATQIRHTLDQLLALEAIDRTGSFATAAKELHRVPSAISYAIRCLEDSFEVKLFDRSRQKAELTPAGRRILEESAHVLEAARQLENVAAQLSGGWEPELHVVIDGSLPLQPVNRALCTFAERKIPTRIRIDVEYQRGVPDRFMDDRANLMMILDFEDDSGTLEWEAMPTIVMMLVCSSSHPIKTEAAAMLDHTEIVVKDSSPRFRKRPREAFTGSKNVVYLSDFHAKRLALLAGAGFGWIPQHLIQKDLKDGKLSLIESEELHQWAYNPQLVRRKNSPLGRAGTLFRDLLLESQSE